MRNDFEKAMTFRHACKIFDANKSISEADEKFILEAGRWSPSSFGMEPWKFFVIRNKELKEKIQQASWNQPQITTSSLLIVLAYEKDLRSTDERTKKQFDLLGFPDAYKQMYASYIDHLRDEDISNWADKQCHLAASNMLTGAAYIGIDSCPIGGFEESKVLEILNLDSKKYGISLLLPFGYRINPPRTGSRNSLANIVKIY